jgi:Zn-dependent protease
MELFFYLVFLIILIFSVVAHEISHGLMADYLGDPTARLMGRLSLNPIRHVDPLGSIIVPGLLILFGTGIVVGWAKPVPVNPLNFKDRRYGEAKVSVAGPATNLIIALFFGLFMRVAIALGFDTPFALNLFLFFQIIVWINLLLAIFNLMPVPPLDGSHILFTFLPERFNKIKLFLQQNSLLVLLIFFMFLFRLIIPIVGLLFRAITGTPGLGVFY